MVILRSETDALSKLARVGVRARDGIARLKVSRPRKAFASRTHRLEELVMDSERHQALNVHGPRRRPIRFFFWLVTRQSPRLWLCVLKAYAWADSAV